MSPHIKFGDRTDFIGSRKILKVYEGTPDRIPRHRTVNIPEVE